MAIDSQEPLHPHHHLHNLDQLITQFNQFEVNDTEISKGIVNENQTEEFEKARRNEVEDQEDSFKLLDCLYDLNTIKLDHATQSNNPSKLSLPFPNFLINPIDDQFPPYLDYSPAQSTCDDDDDELIEGYQTFPSPTTDATFVRSHQASIALKKLLESQDQMLTDMRKAWMEKYPVQVPTSLHIEPISKPPAAEKINSCSLSRRRSLTDHSPISLSTLPADRLSLCDGQDLVVNIESWKADAEEENRKKESVRLWISHLPSPDQLEKLELSS
ncbi:hypothetical protein O181_066610 [Austropuccinia psidii MF-1]|uniref:Uncharacterized protein n=1 Tax=Austropuccinia psidii MF-1 TaxID=1389203 RepID=A0A9Q3EXD8_9BASI|nr:hypothetical protein [Austropuccinia psidii MF-1]